MFFLSLYSNFNLFPHLPQSLIFAVIPSFLPGYVAAVRVYIFRPGPDHPHQQRHPAPEKCSTWPDEIKPDQQHEKSAPVLEIYKNKSEGDRVRNGSRDWWWWHEMLYRGCQRNGLEDRKAAFGSIFSLRCSTATVGYEKQMEEQTNLEFKLGYIGPGISTAIREGRGYIVKAGINSSGPRADRPKRASPTRSTESTAVEIIFSLYSRSDEVIEPLYFTNAVINLCFGRQHVFRNKILLDPHYAGFRLRLAVRTTTTPPPPTTTATRWTQLHVLPASSS